MPLTVFHTSGQVLDRTVCFKWGALTPIILVKSPVKADVYSSYARMAAFAHGSAEVFQKLGLWQENFDRWATWHFWGSLHGVLRQARRWFNVKRTNRASCSSQTLVGLTDAPSMLRRYICIEIWVIDPNTHNFDRTRRWFFPHLTTRV